MAMVCADHGVWGYVEVHIYLALRLCARALSFRPASHRHILLSQGMLDDNTADCRVVQRLSGVEIAILFRSGARSIFTDAHCGQGKQSRRSVSETAANCSPSRLTEHKSKSLCELVTENDHGLHFDNTAGDKGAAG